MNPYVAELLKRHYEKKRNSENDSFPSELDLLIEQRENYFLENDPRSPDSCLALATIN